MTIERVMDIIAEFESGGRFDAWNPNDAGKGISFGKFQFHQRGGLHGLLVRMHQSDTIHFIECFGSATPLLLDLRSLKEMKLNEPGWKFRFQQAAKRPVFQNCQLEEAVESYAKPAAKLCKEHGLKSWLWLALITDASIQYGFGGCKRLLAQALAEPGIDGVMDTFAESTDANIYNRRHKLLVHPEFADRAAFTWDSERWGIL